ncbi:hypothetical protein GCM10020221_29260 [Streptomyces thioluteus]|uniref:DNA-binding phage zinc finger domain-containing protein n=2 Tax=Streptomyces TaxID=1883 RepID=A0A2N8NXF7_STREU|nr:hypothetical protein [Streptomyces eurocidicus]MBB5120482.1 hypothetical protein [Streptomyces eurocidicus]MBF6053693.1 hypothetical protein [Streptomyces eurocidicus]PNE33442.1 hypothetical protein AF335_11170 [Streptomyces eurocidicus]
MTPREIVALLDRVATIDGRIDRQLNDASSAERVVTRWTTALADVPATLPAGSWDVGRVVRNYYERRGGDNSAQYHPVEPYDILTAWARHRDALMQRHTDPTPAADPDDVPAFLTEMRTTRTAVATGRAAPIEYRALTSGPHPAIEARLRAIGSCIPSPARAELARYRPVRAVREAAVAAGQPDPLNVRCDWCQAPEGRPCRSRRVRPDGSVRSNARRATPHPSRVELATAQHGGEAAA